MHADPRIWSSNGVNSYICWFTVCTLIDVYMHVRRLTLCTGIHIYTVNRRYVRRLKLWPPLLCDVVHTLECGAPRVWALLFGNTKSHILCIRVSFAFSRTPASDTPLDGKFCLVCDGMSWPCVGVYKVDQKVVFTPPPLLRNIILITTLCVAHGSNRLKEHRKSWITTNDL